MGRAAGHLALGIAKASAATLAIIPEEFRNRPVTVDEVCDIIIGSIIKRRAEGSQYGIVVLAEGLIEAMGEEGLVKALPEGQLERFGKVVRDDHGHLRLGEIEFGRLMKELLSQRLEKLGIKMTFIDKDLGYELRCADPIPFDAEYTRDLGYAAVKFLLSPEAEKYGAIISFVDGKMNPLPFDKMLDPKTGRMQNRKVNVDGEAYECACAYMIRLEREDFENAKQLTKCAERGGDDARTIPRTLRLSRWFKVKFYQHIRRRGNSPPPFFLPGKYRVTVAAPRQSAANFRGNFKWRLSPESRYAEGGLVAPAAFRIPHRQLVASRKAGRTGTLFLNPFWDGRLGQLAVEFQ